MRKYYLEATCPYCHEALEDLDTLIGNHPALKFLVENRGKKGYIWISSAYGDHETIEPEELNILPGDIVKFFCPHCKKALPIVEKCYCKGDQLRLTLASGGEIQFCNRKGCYYSSLRFINPDDLDKFLGLQK